MKLLSVLLVEGKIKFLWFAKVLLLFHVRQNKSLRDKREFSSVEIFEIAPNPNKVDDFLDRVCLRWATIDKSEHFFLL